MSEAIIQNNNRTITRHQRTMANLSKELEAVYLPIDVRAALKTSLAHFQRCVTSIQESNATLGVQTETVQA